MHALAAPPLLIMHALAAPLLPTMLALPAASLLFPFMRTDILPHFLQCSTCSSPPVGPQYVTDGLAAGLLLQICHMYLFSLVSFCSTCSCPLVGPQ